MITLSLPKQEATSLDRHQGAGNESESSDTDELVANTRPRSGTSTTFNDNKRTISHCNLLEFATAIIKNCFHRPTEASSHNYQPSWNSHYVASIAKIAYHDEQISILIQRAEYERVYSEENQDEDTIDAQTMCNLLMQDITLKLLAKLLKTSSTPTQTISNPDTVFREALQDIQKNIGLYYLTTPGRNSGDNTEVGHHLSVEHFNQNCPYGAEESTESFLLNYLPNNKRQIYVEQRALELRIHNQVGAPFISEEQTHLKLTSLLLQEQIPSPNAVSNALGFVAANSENQMAPIDSEIHHKINTLQMIGKLLHNAPHSIHHEIKKSYHKTVIKIAGADKKLGTLSILKFYESYRALPVPIITLLALSMANASIAIELWISFYKYSIRVDQLSPFIASLQENINILSRDDWPAIERNNERIRLAIEGTDTIYNISTQATDQDNLIINSTEHLANLTRQLQSLVTQSLHSIQSASYLQDVNYPEENTTAFLYINDLSSSTSLWAQNVSSIAKATLTTASNFPFTVLETLLSSITPNATTYASNQEAINTINAFSRELIDGVNGLQQTTTEDLDQAKIYLSIPATINGILTLLCIIQILLFIFKGFDIKINTRRNSNNTEAGNIR